MHVPAILGSRTGGSSGHLENLDPRERGATRIF